ADEPEARLPALDGHVRASSGEAEGGDQAEQTEDGTGKVGFHRQTKLSSARANIQRLGPALRGCGMIFAMARKLVILLLSAAALGAIGFGVLSAVRSPLYTLAAVEITTDPSWKDAPLGE